MSYDAYFLFIVFFATGVAVGLVLATFLVRPIPTPPRELKIFCPMCQLNKHARPLDGSEMSEMKYYMNRFARMIHIQNERWWLDLKTARNKSEMVLLMHSELSEVTEAIRRPGMMDKHLPHRQAEEVELADCVIRILDYADGFGMDIGGAMTEKIEFNRTRADHQLENRLKPGGKLI